MISSPHVARFGILVVALLVGLSAAAIVTPAGAKVQARGQQYETIIAGGNGRFVWSRWDPHQRVMRLVETRDERRGRCQCVPARRDLTSSWAPIVPDDRSPFTRDAGDTRR